MQEWVLTMEPQTKAFINVRRADGRTHYAEVALLWIEQPNVRISPPCCSRSQQRFDLRATDMSANDSNK